jgi:hypothetical protein
MLVLSSLSSELSNYDWCQIRMIKGLVNKDIQKCNYNSFSPRGVVTGHYKAHLEAAKLTAQEF